MNYCTDNTHTIQYVTHIGNGPLDIQLILCKIICNLKIFVFVRRLIHAM
jgi:hypothetical protein